MNRIAELEQKHAKHLEWCKPYVQRNGWTVIPPGVRPPAEAAMSNEERSELEVLQFKASPPDRYFLYVSEPKALATTFTGDTLGTVSFGREWRDNFGGRRVPVTVRAVNGRTYHGTFFKSSGDYARVKIAKH